MKTNICPTYSLAPYPCRLATIRRKIPYNRYYRFAGRNAESGRAADVCVQPEQVGRIVFFFDFEQALKVSIGMGIYDPFLLLFGLRRQLRPSLC